MSAIVVVRRYSCRYTVLQTFFEYSSRSLFVADRIVNEETTNHAMEISKRCLHSKTFDQSYYYCSSLSRNHNKDTITGHRYYAEDSKARFDTADGSKTLPTGSEQFIAQSSADDEPAELITIDYRKGLPRLTIPLPSRKEKCRFTLKPVSNTVGDLIQMICQEDRGIDRVILCTKDGTKIASSNTIGLLLMEEEEFILIINDRRYKLKIPASQAQSFTKDDMERLSDVRNLVSQLYEALQVGEFQIQKERELTAKLESIRSSLEPLEREREILERRVGTRTSLLTWIGLGMMGVQFGILARLTWWEYSWDIMEPVTYFVTYGTAMAMYAYFAVTKEDYVLPEVKDRQHLIFLHKKAKKSGFDVNRYNALKDQLAQVQCDLTRLKDPLHYNANVSHLQFDPEHGVGSKFGKEDTNAMKNIVDNVKTYLKIQSEKLKKFKR